MNRTQRAPNGSSGFTTMRPTGASGSTVARMPERTSRDLASSFSRTPLRRVPDATADTPRRSAPAHGSEWTRYGSGRLDQDRRSGSVAFPHLRGDFGNSPRDRIGLHDSRLGRRHLSGSRYYDRYYRPYGVFNYCYTPRYPRYRYPYRPVYDSWYSGYYGSIGFTGLWSYPYNYGYADTVVYYPSSTVTYVPQSYTTVYTGGADGVTYAPPAAQPQHIPVDQAAGVAAPADQPAAAPEAQLPAQPHPIELGNRVFAEGRYAEARSHYMGAALADEDDGFARLFYGLASFALGEFEAASAAFRRSLTLSKELIDAPIDLRQFYKDGTQLDAQLAALERRTLEVPSDREAGLLLGYLYYATAAPDKALAEFQRLVDAEPTDELAALLRDATKRVTHAIQATPSESGTTIP